MPRKINTENHSLSARANVVVKIFREKGKRLIRNWWFWLILIILLSWVGWQARSDMRIFGAFILDQERFSTYIRRQGLLGPVLLWLLNAAQILIAVIPGHPIALASGYIYGTFFGFVIMYTSTIVAGQAAFLLARRFGRPLVVRFVPEKMLARWDYSSRNYGFMFYLITLLIPIFPTDVLTFVAGLSMISIPKFTLANIIGRAPYLFAMSLIGALGINFLVQGLSVSTWITLAAAMVILILAYLYLAPVIKRIVFPREQ